MRNKSLYVLRCKNELNQTDMAKKLGVCVSMYSLIERFKRKGSKEFWKRLQDEFGLSNDEIECVKLGNITF